MRIAVVTGASSGLGRELALRIDQKEKNIDEIWVIARSREKLEALKSLCKTSVRVLCMDLTKEESLDELEKALMRENLKKKDRQDMSLNQKRRRDASSNQKASEDAELDKETEKDENIDIRILVNAAGFGKIGSYSDVSRKDSGRMIDLNCKAAVEVTQLCLPYMSAGSRLMMICSTSGFQPFPYLNVYAASKAFLYRYTRALRVELWPHKILVTAVCPYWIKDTAFIPEAKTTDEKSAIRHFPMSSTVKRVAAWSYTDNRLGLAVSTPGIVCSLHRIVAKFIPATLMMDLWWLIRKI